MNYVQKRPELHLASLAQLLIDIAEEDSERYVEWTHAADWLLIAAGVNSITFDRASLDPQFGWCSGADRFEIRRDDLHTQILLDLTRFTYTWGALESIISTIKPSGKKGKISSACEYICNRFNPGLGIPLFDKLLNLLNSLYDEHTVANTVTELGEYAAPLKIVYSKRNEFAHGALRFPIPEEHDISDENSKLIVTSTTFVALSIQMLLSSFFSDKEIAIDDFRWDEYEETGIHSLLRSIHVEPPE